MPQIRLQRPLNQCSTNKSVFLHVHVLARRLALWSTGDINLLLEEGRAIQGRLSMRSNCGKNNSDQQPISFQI